MVKYTFSRTKHTQKPVSNKNVYYVLLQFYCESNDYSHLQPDKSVNMCGLEKLICFKMNLSLLTSVRI